MSGQGTHVTCRRCNEDFPIEDESCPHCGKSVRNTAYLAGGGLLGMILVVASLFNLSELAAFGVLGLVIAGSCGYLLYNKRQRIKEASEIAAENSPPPVDNSTE